MQYGSGARKWESPSTEGIEAVRPMQPGRLFRVLTLCIAS